MVHGLGTLWIWGAAYIALDTISWVLGLSEAHSISGSPEILGFSAAYPATGVTSFIRPISARRVQSRIRCCEGPQMSPGGRPTVQNTEGSRPSPGGRSTGQNIEGSRARSWPFHFRDYLLWKHSYLKTSSWEKPGGFTMTVAESVCWQVGPPGGRGLFGATRDQFSK